MDDFVQNFIAEGIAEEDGTPIHRYSSHRKIKDKQKSDVAADIQATPEGQKTKKKIQKSKISKKAPKVKGHAPEFG